MGHRAVRKEDMLSLLYRHPLYFPKLRYCHEQPNVPKASAGSCLYELDWSTQTEKIQSDWYRNIDRMAKEGMPVEDMEFKWWTPEPYREQVEQLRFLLDSSYMRGIHKMVRYGMEIWNDSWDFDTNIRDACSGPAVEAIWCAFMLLEDCLYNEGRNFYERDPAISEIALCSMCLRFWDHQTGRGLLWDFAKVERAREMATGGRLDPIATKTLFKFVKAVQTATRPH
jgi:hypothetical protein